MCKPAPKDSSSGDEKKQSVATSLSFDTNDMKENESNNSRNSSGSEFSLTTTEQPKKKKKKEKPQVPRQRLSKSGLTPAEIHNGKPWDCECGEHLPGDRARCGKCKKWKGGVRPPNQTTTTSTKPKAEKKKKKVVTVPQPLPTVNDIYKNVSDKSADDFTMDGALILASLGSGKKYMACCGKILCSGCIYSPVYDNQGNKVAEEKCPFCRSALDVCDSEFVKRYEKRMEVNDAWAFYDAGGFTADGVNGYQQNCTKALELWHRAGELGQASAYWNISTTYTRVGEKDMEKVVHYWELAAMLGHVKARHELGRMEAWVGNMDRSLRGWDRALKHFTIAAGLGCSNSLEEIKKLYTDGIARKEVYTKALRLYQTYLDEVKSAQRDEAAEYDEK